MRWRLPVSGWKAARSRHGTGTRSRETADRVESVIRSKFVYLSEVPGGGHRRQDLTSADVRFFSVYSYLIVYRPETQPLQIVAVLHGRRNLTKILPQRGV
jgi:plasmid stabilization system protein ParE